MAHPILLYDGVCELCNRFVQFILRRDREGVFRFAWLQGARAERILQRHGISSGELDTVYVVVNCDLPGERLLARSDAVMFVLKELGGRWRVAEFFLRLLPRFLRNAAYNAVARRRYRLFGRSEICRVPSDQDRSRFLDEE
jgi:predicted DCC family thiol-disulfide oxidoreductase YuxK